MTFTALGSILEGRRARGRLKITCRKTAEKERIMAGCSQGKQGCLKAWRRYAHTGAMRRDGDGDGDDDYAC